MAASLARFWTQKFAQLLQQHNGQWAPEVDAAYVEMLDHPQAKGVVYGDHVLALMYAHHYPPAWADVLACVARTPTQRWANDIRRAGIWAHAFPHLSATDVYALAEHGVRLDVYKRAVMLLLDSGVAKHTDMALAQLEHGGQQRLSAEIIQWAVHKDNASVWKTVDLDGAFARTDDTDSWIDTAWMHQGPLYTSIREQLWTACMLNRSHSVRGMCVHAAPATQWVMACEVVRQMHLLLQVHKLPSAHHSAANGSALGLSDTLVRVAGMLELLVEHLDSPQKRLLGKRMRSWGLPRPPSLDGELSRHQLQSALATHNMETDRRAQKKL